MSGKTHGLKLARTTFEEVSRLWSFLQEIELLSQVTGGGFYSISSAIRDGDISQDDFKILKIEDDENKDEIEEDILKQIFSFVSGESRYQCAMFNLDTLLRNCVDLDSDVLEFSPSIQKGLELLEKVSEKVIEPEDPSVSC